MRRDAKRDSNHKDVIDELRNRGVPFLDLSRLGCGIPDLVVENGGLLELWEIKNPKTSYGRRGLNKNQVAWAAKWKGNPVRIIKSVSDAVDALARSKEDVAQAVFDRARAEWRRTMDRGATDPSFVRVTLDEAIRWYIFTGQPDPLNARACGQNLVVVW